MLVHCGSRKPLRSSNESRMRRILMVYSSHNTTRGNAVPRADSAMWYSSLQKVTRSLDEGLS